VPRSRGSALFVLIGTAGVAVPVAISVVAPKRTDSVLGRVRTRLVRYDSVILTILGVAIGAKFVFDGLAEL
jgi:hypothetical protein